MGQLGACSPMEKKKFVDRVNLADLVEYPIEKISSLDLWDFSSSVSDNSPN